MNCLELFSGTHSVGKVLKEYGHNVISLDLKRADINCDILEWDYTVFPQDYFDYIHASPPCDTFSVCRKSWIGRKLKAHGDKIITMEDIIQDQLDIGVPIVMKMLEIINYFNPTYYTIENPRGSDIKKYIPTEIEFTDADYCMYGFPYQKRTRIWNNFNFKGKLCDKMCGNIQNGKHVSMKNGIICRSWDNTNKGDERYRIPHELVRDWINSM